MTNGSIVIDHSSRLADDSSQNFVECEGRSGAVKAISWELEHNIHNTVLVGGRTGSGKSVVVRQAIDRYKKTSGPGEGSRGLVIHLHIDATHNFAEPRHLYFAILRELKWQLEQNFVLSWPRKRYLACLGREETILSAQQLNKRQEKMCWLERKLTRSSSYYDACLSTPVREILDLAVNRIDFSVRRLKQIENEMRAKTGASAAVEARGVSLEAEARVRDMASLELSTLDYDATAAQADAVRVFNTLPENLRLIVVIDELDKVPTATVTHFRQWLKPLLDAGNTTFIFVTGHDYFYEIEASRSLLPGFGDLFSRLVYVPLIVNFQEFIKELGDSFAVVKDWHGFVGLHSLGQARRLMQQASSLLMLESDKAKEARKQVAGLLADLQEARDHILNLSAKIAQDLAKADSVRSAVLEDEYWLATLCCFSCLSDFGGAELGSRLTDLINRLVKEGNFVLARQQLMSVANAVTAALGY